MACLLFAASAGAAIPASLTLSGNCTQDAIAPEDYFFCDDGIPNAGGLLPNLTGASAVTVPAKYGGDGYTGLPSSAGALTDPGADASGNVALDVDVSYPNPADFPGPRPLLVFMHGCCSGSKTSWEATGAPGQRFDSPGADGKTGELWHYNNAWFASRGYIVLNYTARGFVNGQNLGSTGQTQLDARNFEINDFQSLGCQFTQLFNGDALLPDIDPSKVVVTGGSYGAGFSWMALTDPFWNCAATGAPAINMGLAAAAPKYGWTDLANSLVPTGFHSGRAGKLPDTSGCDSGPVQAGGANCPGTPNPVGVAKRSIVSALYISGASGIPPGTPHTTFPSSVTSTFACTQGPDFSAQGQSCPGVTTTLSDFIRERSAYYQDNFFGDLAANPSYAISVYAAGTFTDWLFPSTEHRRMVNRLLSVRSNYPVQTYYGDYQHFTQNKGTVWGDVCSNGGLHVCTTADFAGNFNAAPPTRVRQGVTSRLNAFIDHYALPGTPADLGTPAFDTTAELEVCPQNAASLGVDAGQGGPQFTAPSFDQLAPNTLTIDATGAQTTTNKAAPNTHAVNDDPVKNLAANGGKCPVETDDAGSGVASYTSEVLPHEFTMLGSTALNVTFAATGPVAQMDARLYDVKPDGSAILVDRGPRRLRTTEASSGQVSYEIFGAGWRFPAGDKIRIELMQDDDPFLHFTEAASSASLSKAVLRVPIREPSATLKAGPTLQKGFCANKTVGTKLGETLKGTKRSDRILGRGGRDRISGLGDRDCLAGGAKNDRIAGGKGKDRVSGGKGRDRISGGRGGDLLVGGGGKDVVSGGHGRDRLRTRDHKRDVVRCGKGRDRAIVDRRDKVVGCEKVKRGRGRG